MEHRRAWNGASGSRPITRGNVAGRQAGRRLFGAIEKLPSGRYRARYKADGRWLNSPTTFATKTEAGIFLDSVRTDMVRGAWKAPRFSRMSLDAYGRTWIEQRESLKATTRREFESCWRNHIGPFIGTRRLDEVTPDMVRDWHAQTKADFSLNSRPRTPSDWPRRGRLPRGLGRTAARGNSPRRASATAQPRRHAPAGFSTRCSPRPSAPC